MSEPRPIKVILLSDRFDRPGSGAYAAALTRSLCERGHDVFLLATELPAPELFAELNLPVRLVRRLSAWGTGGANRKWLVGELKVFGANVVHAAVPQLAAAARKIARKLDLPSVITVHEGGVGEKAWRASDLRDSAVIAASQSVRGDLVNHHRIEKSRITVIYPGVLVRPGQLPELKPERRAAVVGTIGSLEYVEGHRFLLQAAAMVLAHGLSLQLLVCGSGPEKHSLRELVIQLGLGDAVTFVDDISRPRELLDVMDIFVLPTMREGMSPIVLEAMGLAKPVVVSGAGGVFAAVQHNHTGLVVEKGNAEALAAAITRLMLKPDFARRIALEGRDLVRQEFSLDRMVENTLQTYVQLIQRAGALV